MLTHQKPDEVVTGMWRAWAQQDKATTLSYCSDDMIFSLFVPEHILPFGGETKGKASVSDRLQTIIDQFETLAYEGSAKALVELWIAVRASLRTVLETTTVADLAKGELPPEVKALTADPEAWSSH